MFTYYMPLEDLGVSLNQDSRGVSEVIGFLLVFGFIIILLSINQAQFVPQENSEIEFQHYQDVQDDMVEVRSSISTAGQADVSQYPTVELGTSYPTRLFALNPPAPAGTFQTSDKYDITLQNASNSATIETQFLTYRPGYNELDENPIWYENSVLYIDARDNGGEVAVLEDQNLIRGDSQVRINAMQNDFSVTSTGQVTIEVYPTKNTTVNLEEWTGDVNIKIPTRLNGSEYWDDELGKYDEDYDGVTYHDVIDHPDDGIHLVNLTVDANSLKFNTVGIDSAPEGQGSASRGIGVGENTGGGGDGGTDGGGTTSYYPTSYTENVGTLSNFENMQADDGSVATLEGVTGGGTGGGDPFNVTTVTDTVPAGDYTLEIEIGADSNFKSDDTVAVTVSDANGEIGSGTINDDEAGFFTIDLDPSVEGDITVRYQAGEKQT